MRISVGVWDRFMESSHKRVLEMGRRMSSPRNRHCIISILCSVMYTFTTNSIPSLRQSRCFWLLACLPACLPIFKTVVTLTPRSHQQQSNCLSPSFPHQSSVEILSGTSGCGVDTALIKSSTTLLPDFLPAASISLTLESASLLASSSAFLLPLVC